MTLIANTPKPPYYAVIFTSHRTEGDNGYGQMAERMVELASEQPGFLGIESVREGAVLLFRTGLILSLSKDGRRILSILRLRI